MLHLNRKAEIEIVQSAQHHGGSETATTGNKLVEYIANRL
jgi:hypothetical protein